MRPDIDILIVQLRDGRPATRTEAAKVLADNPSPLARNDLIKCLLDVNENVRYWATWALAQLGGDDLLEKVARQLEDVDNGVRMIAAKALSIHSCNRATHSLLQVIDDPSDNVAYWVSCALAKLGKSVVPRLIALLSNHNWLKRSAAAKTLVRIGDSSVKPVLKALSSSDSDTRYWAIYILGELRREGTAESLIPFLRCEDVNLICRAIASLTSLGFKGAIPVFVELLGHKEESVRLASIEGLATFGDYSVKPLTDLLESNERVCRVSATASLALVGDVALKSIFDKLKEESGELRFWAVRALERFDNPAIIPVLVDLLDDDSTDIRLAAASALKSYVLPDETAFTLVSRLSSADWRLRRSISEVLSSQTHLSAERFFRFFAGADDDTRYWIVWIIGHLAREDGVRYLLQAFDDPSWPVRKRASESVSLLGKKAVPHLLAVIGQENVSENVRYWLSRALIGIRDERLLPVLIDMFEDHSWSVRENAFEAFLIFGERAVSTLIDALRTRSSRVVRQKISECLQRIEGVNCSALVSLYQFRDPDLVYWTSQVLGGIGEKAIPSLKRTIRDGEERMRYLAMEAASLIDHKEIHDLAIEILEDEYVSLRRVAVSVLGEFRVAKAVEPLIKADVDANQELRLLIIKALGRIGDSKALPLLLKYVNHDRWDIRKEAILALGRLGDAAGMEPLITVLDDSDNLELNAFLVEAIGSHSYAGDESLLLKPRVQISLLKQLHETTSGETKASIIRALGRSRNPELYDEIVACIDSPVWEVRKAVIEAIGLFPKVPSIEPLKKIVDSGDVILRSMAHRALQKILGEQQWSLYLGRTIKKALYDPAEVHYQKAMELRNNGEREKAALEIRIAIRCRRKWNYYTFLGTVHLEMKRFDLAVINLKKASDLKKGEPEILIKLATACSLNGQKKEALGALKELLAIPSLDPPFKELAGKLMERVSG